METKNMKSQPVAELSAPWRPRKFAISGTLYVLVTLQLEAQPAAPLTEFSLERRVACQTAIEEVYWKHRIWPQNNPHPKPPLAEALPQKTILQRVEDAVAMSVALDEIYGSPLGAAQLQAELDRMAANTGNPERLAELFQALGNDATAVAECLVRPTLAERQLRALFDQTHTTPQKPPFELWWQGTRGSLRTRAFSPPVHDYKLPRFPAEGPCENDVWLATSEAPISPEVPPEFGPGRSLPTAIWTGSEMIVFGGWSACPPPQGCHLNSGVRYDPATDTWSSTSDSGAPEGRIWHTAVWTGATMIVWGGSGNGNNNNLSSGASYNPTTNSWTPTSMLDAPQGRYIHSAVWTGSEMIVWGGRYTTINLELDLNSGGRYSPATNSWVPTTTNGSPEARALHTAVWTGTRMIIWGGSSEAVPGGIYDPATNSWSQTNTTSAPQAHRFFHTAVWTGTRMIVWGGEVVNDSPPAAIYSNTGGSFDPVANAWTPTSTVAAPEPRSLHTAVWTGTEMIVWGGTNHGGEMGSGGRYDPVSLSWSPTSTSGESAPGPRAVHIAVWTGDEMIVWGGSGETAPIPYGLWPAGARYCAASAQQWIALGDSYSSGEGAGSNNYLPGTAVPGVNMCHRSATAYSQVMLNLQRTADSFFACSGAETVNVIHTDYEGQPQCFQDDGPPYLCDQLYTPPDDVPQLNHPDLASADLVTLTIGGNDVQFAEILKWCYVWNDCENYTPFGWSETLGEAVPVMIDLVEFQLESTLEAIALRAPNASIRILGYPALFPADAGGQTCSALADPVCWGEWTPAEQTWLNSLAPRLNQAIQMAAANMGARFIDVSGFFAGHETCGSSPSWFVPPPTDSCTSVLWNGTSPELFHPTPIGHLNGYRRALEEDLGAVPLPSKTTHTLPTLNKRQLDARKLEGQKLAASLHTLGALRVKVIAPNCGGVVLAGQTLAVSGGGFAAGALVTILLDLPPAPSILKTITVDSNGDFGTTVAIPEGVSAHGMAPLQASGMGANFQPRALVSHITIGPSLSEDQDGDGVPDACDNCPAIFNSTQMDADQDNRGDVCDPCLMDSTNLCNEGILFRDGFEHGDTQAWSATLP